MQRKTSQAGTYRILTSEKLGGHGEAEWLVGRMLWLLVCDSGCVGIKVFVLPQLGWGRKLREKPLNYLAGS